MTIWTSGASRPERDGLQYHIRCRPGDVARYVLLPGDPARVLLIAAGWAEGREIAVEREHVTFTGTLREGGPISACSTAAGGPSTATALEELIAIGADTFVGCFSVAPVFDTGRPYSSEKPALEINFRPPTIVGIAHGTPSDDTGVKLGAVTPVHLFRDLVDTACKR